VSVKPQSPTSLLYRISLWIGWYCCRLNSVNIIHLRKRECQVPRMWAKYSANIDINAKFPQDRKCLKGEIQISCSSKQNDHRPLQDFMIPSSDTLCKDMA
jgi:hypothetical protein